MKIHEKTLLDLALALVVIAALVLSVAACRCPEPKEPAVKPLPKVEIVQTWTSCLAPDRETAPAYISFAPDATGACGAPFALCYDRPNANGLRLYLESLETWIARAIESCKKRPQPTETP